MIKINIYKQSSYPVSAKKIKDIVKKVFQENGIQSDATATVAVVSRKRLTEIAQEYLKESKEVAEEHPVLSFPTSEMEGPFLFPPDGKIHVGEIVISYQSALEDSKKTGKLIDDAVCELAEHGALHLVGVHHD